MNFIREVFILTDFVPREFDTLLKNHYTTWLGTQYTQWSHLFALKL